jgi:shikimate dehydrogenase
MTGFNVTARSSVCLIIGDPVAHSLSPAMHNAAYEALGIPFVMAGAHVRVESLAAAIAGFKALSFRGLSVTMPHKVSIIPLLDELDATAKEIGAVNTVVYSDSKLTGYNTDWLGILHPLERLTELKGRRVALLGAGGAAQAALYACTSRGAHVTIFNRSLEKAQALAARWGCASNTLNAVDEIRSCDILINSTSVGMAELDSESPISSHCLHKAQIVFETIYSPRSTRLVHDAEACGARVIRGLEMFLEQGLAQFQLHTGVKPPREVMQKVLEFSLNA